MLYNILVHSIDVTFKVLLALLLLFIIVTEHKQMIKTKQTHIKSNILRYF